jgi:formyltetrahydrofolate-dependent phosphoribosylglycinamide formyltransferase
VTSLQPDSPLSVALLISGGGTTLRNLLAKIEQGELDIAITQVISSNPDSPGLSLAADAGIATHVADRRDYSSVEAFSAAVFAPCRQAEVDLVVMGGFLKQVLVPPDFAGRVMNIHPALIPAFCGKGFYGHHVHEAVLKYATKVSGCTVHFVDDQYDHGPIIIQRVVPVLDDDTPDTLARRVFQQECEAYPEAIRLFAQGRLRIEGRRVRVC